MCKIVNFLVSSFRYNLVSFRDGKGEIMNNRLLLTLLLVSLLFLAACQPAAPEATQPPAIEYPAPAENMPVTEAPVSAVDGSSIYPGLNDGSVIDWPQLEAFALNGEVMRIVEGASSSVTITLKDGRTFSIANPQPGYVDALIQSCGDICKEIEIVKE
jgi:hypothetical protein